MPLFHFHLADHVFDPDEEGTELPGVEEARREAIRFAGDYVSDHPDLLQPKSAVRIRVTDDYGMALFTVNIDLTMHDYG